MNLSSLIKKIHRNMPGAVMAQAISHLNWAYKEIICQDNDDFIFYGGKATVSEGDEHKERDPFTKYPILYNFMVAENPLLKSDWTTFYLNEGVPQEEGFDYSEIQFSYDYGNEDFLYNSYKKKIILEVYDIPVAVRKIKSLFTFKNGLIGQNQSIAKPFTTTGRTPITSYGDLVYVPFTQRVRSESLPCIMNVEGSMFDVKTPFFVEFYYEPPDIVNENSYCFLNLQEFGTMLFEGALGDYEEEVNSNSTRKEMFLQVMKNNYRLKNSTNSRTNGPNKFQKAF